MTFTGRESTAKDQKENMVKKIRLRYRLGTLVAVIFLPVCALLANGMPGASAASTSAQATSSSMTTVKFADAAVASAVAHSTPPRHHPPGAAECEAVVKNSPNGYTVGPLVTVGCQSGATGVPGVAPHISIGIQLAVCGGFLTAAGIDPLTMTFACFAAVGPSLLSIQFCGPNFGSDCLNAWGGGPYVNVYTGGDENGDSHQHFMVIDEYGSSNAQIMYTGSGSWFGQCIGDASNNPGLADTSLDACAGPGQAAGWGTQMTWGTSGCPYGTVWFHDNHWNGYLAGSGANGSHFYLNVQTKTCFAIWTDLAA